MKIQLTLRDDVMSVNDEFDKFKFNHVIGTHEFCRGSMYLIPTSEKWMIIRCSRCGLRIPVLRDKVQSYQDLKRYFSNKYLTG